MAIWRFRFVLALFGLMPVAGVAAQTYECRLSAGGSQWAGECTSPDDEPLRMEIRRTAAEEFAWVGAFFLNEMGPLAFDLDPDAGGQGIIRTPFGWLWLEEFAPSEDAVAVGFTIENEVPPGEADLRIIDRALEILAAPALWDRADDRVCDETDRTWSLYCVMVAATIDITGEAQHRQPALQVVRRVVGEVGSERVVDHRLMDYNNHPDTTFEQIREVLRLARERAAAGG